MDFQVELTKIASDIGKDVKEVTGALSASLGGKQGEEKINRIVDNMAKGVVAGYPMVDVKVTLVDGKYHAVDSNDMAFQIAGSLAIRKGALDAGPVLLEPLVEATIHVPEKYLGDIMSDINGRRGKILGTEPIDGYQDVKVMVPESEMLRFALDLRSITQGRGSFSKKFSHYEEMPAHLAKGIIEEFQKQHEAAS